MYIAPSSTITLYRGVPLTPSYQDTIYFGSKAEQYSYFNQLFEKKTFNDQMYQRKDKNICRVEVNAEQIYSYNYMSFRNDAFGDKVFYAFITNVEYLNNKVSEVTYEIDIMQTWAFDYELGKCYVIREHSATDEVGDNLLPEPIEVDDYVCTRYFTGGYNETAFYLFVSEPVSGTPGINGGLFDGMYSVECYTFPCTIVGGTDLDTKIQEIIGDWSSPNPGGLESIVGVFIGPAKFRPQYGRRTPKKYSHSYTRPDDLDGYVPNNKKLLTSPYMYINVDSLNDSKNYMFEYFNPTGEVANFEITGSSVGNASMLCTPVNYKIKGGRTVDYTEQVLLGGYPMCIYPVDTAKNWLSNNSVYHAIGGVASAAVAAAGTGGITGALGIAGMITNMAKFAIETNKANTAKGSIATNINVQNRSKDFYFKIMTIRAEKAKCIDDYFSRYGYTCERVKVPNRNVRKRWTYTKTDKCIVKGNVPADDLARIGKVFDNGVTFWASSGGGSVGNYVMEDNGVL